MRVAELGSPNLDFTVGLSEGDLVATFVSNRLRDAGAFYDVLSAKRASVASPAPVAELATESNVAVTVSSDGRTMVLERGAPPRLYVSERATTSAAWATPQAWAESADGDTMPFLVHDALALYFVRQGAIHRAARTGPGAYGPASPIAWVTAPGEPIRPAVTADELTLYLGDRPAMGTPFDVFVARRASKSAPWGAPVRVDELASTVADWPSWISADGCEIYVSSNRTQNDAGTPDHEFWTATRGN